MGASFCSSVSTAADAGLLLLLPLLVVLLPLPSGLAWTTTTVSV